MQEACIVPFSIGKLYKDELHCDVYGDRFVEIDLYYILLGRPWQYDVDNVNKGRQNITIFTLKVTKIALIPTKDGDGVSDGSNSK